MAMNDTIKLIYLLQELGEYAVVPDGSIVNIGGVKGPNFTVGGKPLMFADGTSTDGSNVSFVTPDLQTVYQNSKGEAFIDFTSGKDFVLQAVNDKQLRFDADTGDVIISGNLIVRGETTTVINTSVATDRVAINQIAGDYIPFTMEPAAGVQPLVNVVDIKTEHSGDSVFTIGPTGETYIASLTTGLINGIDIVELARILGDHLSLEGIKHTADQISVISPATGPVRGNTVQEVVDSIADVVNSLIVREVGDIRGLEHVQSTESDMWTISHGQDTQRIQMTIWDDDNEQVLADMVQIYDSNTVVIHFSTAMTGRAILMLF